MTSSQQRPSRRLRIGGDLPYFDSRHELRDYVQAFEELGYDYLGFGEHVLPARAPNWPSDISPCEPWHESFTQAAFVAALTSRIEIAASVLLPLRPAGIAAKQAAEIDLFSEGRLRLSVSVGWNREEVRALGVDPATRGQLIEEQVEVMRLLWTEPYVTYRGKLIEIVDVAVNPRPERPIPVWMGGGDFEGGGVPGPAVLDRMARLADGYKMFGPLMRDVDAGVDVIRRLRALVADHGRDPGDFGVEARMPLQLLPEEAWTERLETWRQAGATHVTLSNRRGAGGADAEISRLTRFRELTDGLW
ncbi:TIGR03619 family F420-dependent LLM class oxidoreductase [Streptomyces sp. ISL-11]|uniref:TIGR03619 family F420-dependent LLM class oxidoreductase n=1 Tax=Streptomyces sp. ISL-11 TaxID=2819174 RepID=UPI001BE96126|nr:TIGR03619 family F420-dependent LLM class oxidoreductase [Streptomyces sp. ISL-11]MBT2383939.1 TIGR03619 family F420-dependent LLM class oxidoreductase [Streptomyces sp. ISL-11]